MVIANWEDMRDAARRRLPRIFFDYIDGAAFSETTARANIADFEHWMLEQNVLAGVGTRDLSVEFLGKRRPLPLMLGPVGFSGLFCADGEIKAARAAHRHGLPFCLSSFAIASIERLRKATDGDIWFQLYIQKDRAVSDDFVRRAAAEGCEALVVTVDTTVGGIRERDIRNGFRSAKRVTAAMAMQMATRPSWCLQALSAGIPRIENLINWPQYGRFVLEQAANLGGQIEQDLNWDDIRRLREQWHGKLVVKGVINPRDAERCAGLGADAIVVSNHGGRQLDCAPSTVSVLPEVVSEVGSKLDVLVDGGFRRGAQIVKAMALGAKGVLLGRAYAYALGAGGEAMVITLIDMLRAEIDCTIGHMGVTSFPQLSAHSPNQPYCRFLRNRERESHCKKYGHAETSSR